MSFRILSLDGGGSWSLIQALTLIELYRSGGSLLTGHQVLRDFDLVIASSSGSVVLGGLAKDLPLSEIRKYFEDEALRQSFFVANSWGGGLGARLARRIAGIGPRYSARRKLAGLRHLLNSEAGEPGIGDITLDALKTRTRLPTQLMIVAFDYDRQRPVLFRSNTRSHAASFGTPAIATLAEAVHAATNAPVDYFDAPAAVSRGRRCWDAAVGGYNNPILIGIAEALANGAEPQEIQVLSIGTGSVALPPAIGNEDQVTAKLVQGRVGASRQGDLRRLAESLLDDPADDASLIAHLALGQAVPMASDKPVTEGRLVRMNPLVQPIRVPSGWVRPAGLSEADDESDEFLRLRHLAMDASDPEDLALIKKFCTLWHNDAIVNQPIRANSDTLDCEIGQRWYSEAKAQWLALLETPVPASGAPPMPANLETGAAPPPRSMTTPSRLTGSKTH